MYSLISETFGHPKSRMRTDSDHLTRILKSLADKLEKTGGKASAEASEVRNRSRQQVMRSLGMLIRLSGRHVPRFLPQVTVLLGSCTKSGSPDSVRLQSLEGWHTLVEILAAHEAPALASIINQVHPWYKSAKGSTKAFKES